MEWFILYTQYIQRMTIFLDLFTCCFASYLTSFLRLILQIHLKINFKYFKHNNMERIILRLWPWGPFTSVGDMGSGYNVVHCQVCCREVLRKYSYKNSCLDQQFSKCDLGTAGSPEILSRGLLKSVYFHSKIIMILMIP